MNRAAIILIPILFFLRVIAQIYAFVYPEQTLLPNFEQFQSGLMPYFWLLVSQIIILMAMALATYNGLTFQGPLYPERNGVRKFLRMFAGTYILSQLVRFFVQMLFFENRHWYDDLIPMVFHVLLGIYLFCISIRSRSQSAH